MLKPAQPVPLCRTRIAKTYSRPPDTMAEFGQYQCVGSMSGSGVEATGVRQPRFWMTKELCRIDRPRAYPPVADRRAEMVSAKIQSVRPPGSATLSA